MKQFKFSTAFAKRWWKPKCSHSLINQIRGPVPPAKLNICFLPIKSKSAKDVKTKPQLLTHYLRWLWVKSILPWDSWTWRLSWKQCNGGSWCRSVVRSSPGMCKALGPIRCTEREGPKQWFQSKSKNKSVLSQMPLNSLLSTLVADVPL